MLAKLTCDPDLLERSRIDTLEAALSTELLSTRLDIVLVRDNASSEAGEIVRRSRELLDARLTAVREQIGELADLRGKNRSVIEYMMRKVKVEKNEFEQGPAEVSRNAQRVHKPVEQPLQPHRGSMRCAPKPGEPAMRCSMRLFRAACAMRWRASSNGCASICASPPTK